MSVKFATGLAALVTAAALATAAQASTITIPDNTLDVAYHGFSSTPWFPGSSTTGDVIGSGFDTEKVDITVTDTSIEFKFYTQFSGSDLGAHYADIFLATDPAHPDTYNYGIALGFQQAYGGKAAAFYSVTPADYKTSSQIWGPQSGYIYGGQYVNPNTNVAHDAPTVVTGGTPLSGWTVTAPAPTDSGDPNYPYLLDITLSANNANTFASVFNDADIAALWGTGDCNNDAIYMSGIDTPEPASMALFAGGLFGLGAIRRRRAKCE